MLICILSNYKKRPVPLTSFCIKFEIRMDFFFSGKLMTLATWIRNFVSEHPEYKQDSVVTDQINYDLISACDRITKGDLKVPELVHIIESKSSNDIPNSIKIAQDIK